jgi:hypothetical protein
MKIENSNNMNNENKYCEEIELLVDDYLDGMITSEDRQKMEQHLTGCDGCRKYIEETVFLMEKAVLLSKTDNIISDGKKAELWDKIEAKINAAAETSANVSAAQIYNMSGLEDTSSQNTLSQSTVEHIPAKPGVWNSMRYYISGLAAVFVLAFVIYGVTQFMKRSGDNLNISGNDIVEIGGPKWMVTPLKGSPLLNDMVMKAIDSLGIGGYITTNDSSKAELYVAGLGTVVIEPGSKVRLIKSAPGEHRIALDYGSIDASILAKPRTFFVDAGNVTAVDLGCSYKFSVDHGGDGLLYVRSGMVSLESASGRQSLVPEGKYCVTKQDMGPGTPFREDSSPQLKKALMEFDFGNCGGECVNVILKNAKKTDAVTLVNILPRVEEQYKNVVYQKAATYCTPPVNMRRDSVPNMRNAEHLNEWVDKIMEEVHQNIQENISRVEKQIEEQMKQFDEEKFQKEWQKNWDKNVKKNWNFNYNYNHPGLDTLLRNGNTWVSPEAPSLQELEELNQELQELHQDLRIDSEEFKREMEKVKEEMKKVNEEIRREMEDSRKETEKEMRKEVEKENKRREKENKQRNNNDNNDSGEDRD